MPPLLLLLPMPPLLLLLPMPPLLLLLPMPNMLLLPKMLLPTQSPSTAMLRIRSLRGAFSSLPS